MPDKKRTTRSKQTDSNSVPEGVEHKKQKQSPEAGSSGQKAAAKGKTKPGAGLTQATVDSLAETKAEQTDVKLVNPNTGEEVEAKSQPESQPAKHKASKAKGKKGTKLVDPNSGHELTASTEKISQPNSQSPATTQKRESSNNKQEETAADVVKSEDVSEKEQVVKINRAPVLTLWVAVVAEHQGFSKEAGLTFGKAISGMLAQSKGRAIGVMNKKDDTVAAKEEKEEEEHRKGIAKHDVFGMSIKAKDVGDDGDVRAIDTSLQVISHKSVEGYLSRAFKDQLQVARDALSKLATSYKPEEIGDHCYHLYEQFRPTVASGKQGWGQAGQLDLNQLREMAENHSL